MWCCACGLEGTYSQIRYHKKRYRTDACNTGPDERLIYLDDATGGQSDSGNGGDSGEIDGEPR